MHTDVNQQLFLLHSCFRESPRSDYEVCLLDSALMSGNSHDTEGVPNNAGPDTNLDYTEKPYRTLYIAGLPVHVFGLESVKTKNVTVLFFLHGRLGKWEDSIQFIHQTLITVKARNRSLLVVTFDQRK